MESPAPRDPMWATFRERHPDVNLVLLPGDGADETEPPASIVTIDEAREASAALERRVRLIANMLAVPHAPMPGWARTPRGDYEPTARLTGSAVADTPDDPDVIVHRLGQLGWTAAARPEAEHVWVDGHSEEGFVRVTVIDGIVGVRATGARIGLNKAAVDELIGGN